MIDEKWLSNAVFTTVQSQANLSRVKKDSFGDFALGSLSEAVNTNTTNSVTVRAWMASAQDRKSTLVFCVDVAHTQALTQIFREYGIDARYITASTPRQVRGEQLQAFKGKLLLESTNYHFFCRSLSDLVRNSLKSRKNIICAILK